MYVFVCLFLYFFLLALFVCLIDGLFVYVSGDERELTD